MTRLSRDDVIKAVDRADDVTIAQIIGTGATVEELAEAQAWLANDEPMINDLRPLAQGRVRELVDILSELEEEEGRDRSKRHVRGWLGCFPRIAAGVKRRREVRIAHKVAEGVRRRNISQGQLEAESRGRPSLRSLGPCRVSPIGPSVYLMDHNQIASTTTSTLLTF
ncbi:hypothetical protein [Bradyrhizobium sp. BR 1432]|uniref:hypothetical protein n=1 Tax=Bradyrhizobium sp. BR 1432 TaxID=3447966 RepID=UPI003EE7247F